VRLAARLRGADAVVSVGGGSVCDAVKAARLCLANDVTEAADMDRLRGLHADAAVKPPTLASIAIPTTLSAGEFTPNAGVTDERGPRKESYKHPRMPPDVVILDPAMAAATPARLWFGTGMRVVDHAIESWCGIDATPFSDAMSLHALRLLVPALRRCASDRADLDAILQCQLGAWLSIQGFASGVLLGASHGIGHALGGTAGMPHGETSCVMLPHVLRFNAGVNESRQRDLSIAMERASMAAADVVAELVASLGLPGRLRDAGVPRELLPRVAQEGIRDAWVQTNPRPIDGAAGVLALLELAW
jgi:maleylacetate reductase